MIDRKQLLTLAKDAKEFGVITSLPNFTQLFPSAIRSGISVGTLEATAGPPSRSSSRRRASRRRSSTPASTA